MKTFLKSKLLITRKHTEECYHFLRKQTAQEYNPMLEHNVMLEYNVMNSNTPLHYQ